MNSGPTVLHLVSGERMQNLLPLLALNPSRVIQICSSNPAILAAAADTEAAARQAGIKAAFQIHQLASASPTTEDLRYVHKQLMSVFPGAIANITGGTKLMSLGAYLGASEFHDSPILYCDTANRCFVQVGNASLPGNMRSFPEVTSSLTVPVVMAAHGKEPSRWKFDAASTEEFAFGEAAWSLRTRHKEAFRDFGGGIRSFYRSDRGRIPSGAGKLAALIAADLVSAFPDPLPDPIRDFLRAATEAGILASLQDGGFRMADGPANTRALHKHVKKIANLLDGSWLELAVFSFIARSPFHQDSYWSVEPATRDAEYGETDIVAVNSRSSALEIISCKTTVRQPLEHLEGLRTRSNNLGGNHASATLAVLDAGSSADQDRLHRWGKLLRVNVLIGEEIPRYFAPCPPLRQNQSGAPLRNE